MSEATKFSGLSCEAHLSLSWSCVENAVYSSAIEQTNINRMRIVLGLDELPKELQDEHPGVAHELQRLDFKINVILELVGQLVTQGTELPAPVPMVLGADFLQWSGSEGSPEPGSALQISIYLDQRFPFPLILMGLVESVVAVSGAHQVRVSLIPPSEPFQELYEKYVFRCHRRQVARMRMEPTA